MLPLILAIGCNCASRRSGDTALVDTGAAPDGCELGLVALDPGAVVALEVGGAVGVGTVEVPIRFVNALGIAVPAGGATAEVSTVGASPATSTVSADELGYAVVAVSADQPTLVRVTAQGEGLDAVAETASIVAGELPDPDWPGRHGHDLSMGEATFAAGLDGAVAVADQTAIFWQPLAPGAPGHRVAALDETVEGLQSADVDGDGVLDLLAWTAHNALVLSGRAEGGLGWGGGWSLAEGALVSVSAGDVTGDGADELLIAGTGDDCGLVQAFDVDGWSFEALAPLPTQPLRGATAIVGRAGRAVAVLNAAEASMHLWGLASGQWSLYAPGYLQDYEAPGDSTLPPARDLDGDGVQELMVLGAEAGGTRPMDFIDISGSVTVTYHLFFEAFRYTDGDLDGDDLDELVTGPDPVTVAWSADTLTLDRIGSVSVSDLDGGQPDLLVVDEAGLLTVYRSLRGGFAPSAAWDLGMAISGPVSLSDVDGDGALDIVADGDLPRVLYGTP